MSIDEPMYFLTRVKARTYITPETHPPRMDQTTKGKQFQSFSRRKSEI